MATCQTTQWVNTAPYVRLTVTQSSSTATTATLTWTLHYIASDAANTSSNRSYTVKVNGTTVQSSTYNIDGKTGTNTVATGTTTITKGTSAKSVSFSVSFAFNLTWSGSYSGTRSASGSISVAAKTSYAVRYSANGGSGAPGQQTKWHGTALTLSSTKPTRTGYTFRGWATSASGSVAYASGASYTANAAVTLYAVWQAVTYTVAFNANGGSGAPASQTKTYGVTLTLSNTRPTRTNYTFKGWGTASSSTTVSYAAGASYTRNAAITLYAIWELAYVKPTITGMTVKRCLADGTLADEGVSALVNFSWTTYLTVSSITITWKSASSELQTRSLTVSGTSGSVSEVIGSELLTTESSYVVSTTVADSGGSTVVARTLNSLTCGWDVISGGDGISFGKAAELHGYTDSQFKIISRDYLLVGAKRGYLDGATGFLLHPEGYMHIQRITGNPYIAFSKNNTTAHQGVIRLNITNDYMEFTNSTAFQFNAAVLSTAHLSCGRNSASTETGINTLYLDNNLHWIVSRSTDGLSSNFGWTGSADYATIANIRGRTCRYINSSGTTVLSDERLKQNFTDLERWDNFYDDIEPIAFKLKNGTSGRFHMGFKAQQIETALSDNGLQSNDFAGFIKMDHVADEDPSNEAAYSEAGILPGEDEYGLIYSEFIALNVYQIQKLKQEITELRDMITDLQEEIRILKGGNT